MPTCKDEGNAQKKCKSHCSCMGTCLKDGESYPTCWFKCPEIEVNIKNGEKFKSYFWWVVYISVYTPYISWNFAIFILDYRLYHCGNTGCAHCAASPQPLSCFASCCGMAKAVREETNTRPGMVK